MIAHDSFFFCFPNLLVFSMGVFLSVSQLLYGFGVKVIRYAYVHSLKPATEVGPNNGGLKVLRFLDLILQ